MTSVNTGYEGQKEAASLRSILLEKRNRIDALLGMLNDVMGDPLPSKNDVEAGGGQPAPKKKRHAIIEAAVKFIRDKGPIKTPALLQLFQEKEIPINGKRPIQTLYGVLHKNMKSANPKVTRSEDGRWYLSGNSE